jgi:hypothetical protein
MNHIKSNNILRTYWAVVPTRSGAVGLVNDEMGPVGPEYKGKQAIDPASCVDSAGEVVSLTELLFEPFIGRMSYGCLH